MFKNSPADPALSTYIENSIFVLQIVYADDIQLTSSFKAQVNLLMKKLRNK